MRLHGCRQARAALAEAVRWAEARAAEVVQRALGVA